MAVWTSKGEDVPLVSGASLLWEQSPHPFSRVITFLWVSAGTHRRGHVGSGLTVPADTFHLAIVVVFQTFIFILLR